MTGFGRSHNPKVAGSIPPPLLREARKYGSFVIEDSVSSSVISFCCWDWPGEARHLSGSSRDSGSGSSCVSCRTWHWRIGTERSARDSSADVVLPASGRRCAIRRCRAGAVDPRRGVLGRGRARRSTQRGPKTAKSPVRRGAPWYQSLVARPRSGFHASWHAFSSSALREETLDVIAGKTRWAGEPRACVR